MNSLGDRIGEALALVGITDQRVSKWIGRPCRCPERRIKLNALGLWATRVLAGKTASALSHLQAILEIELDRIPSEEESPNDSASRTP